MKYENVCSCRNMLTIAVVLTWLLCHHVNRTCNNTLNEPITLLQWIKDQNFWLCLFQDPIQHGWNDKQTPEWYYVIFLDDASDILFDNNDTITSDDNSCVDSFSDAEVSDSDDSVTKWIFTEVHC